MCVCRRWLGQADDRQRGSRWTSPERKSRSRGSRAASDERRRYLAESGAAAVTLLDLHDQGNTDTAILVGEVGAAALPVHVDLGSVSDIVTAYQSVMTAFDRVDAAAHIGGFSTRGETLDVTGSCPTG